MEEFFRIASNFGFPMAVAGFLLYRQEKKMENVEHSNQEIKNLLERVVDKLDNFKK